MYDVRTDFQKNRLYITLRNSNFADIQQYLSEIESACKYLTSGFTSLTVLNKKGPIQQSDLDLLYNNTSDLLHVYGVSKIVHVREKGDFLGLFQKCLIVLKSHFSVENAKSIREAENILDGKN